MQYSNIPTEQIIRYANPYLTNEIRGSDINEFVAELAKVLIQRHQFWLKQMALDEKPVLDSSVFNQYILWDTLGYGDLPYDVVLTNQLVSSAEDNGMPVHTCLRGGVNGGNMNYSKQGMLGGYVFVSAYQVINNNDLLSLLRNDTDYTEQQIVDYMAATLTHELGHLLFHYGHPFNEVSCIMNPTPMLNYRQWYKQLDADACRLINPLLQQPGAAKLMYNTEW